MHQFFMYQESGMMKRKLRSIFVFIMFMLGISSLITGCSVPDGGEGETMGRFNKKLQVESKTQISDIFNYAYARIVELDDGTLISTGEELNNNFGGIPIYKSKDGGKSFTKNAANVHDPNKTATYNAQWQPTLYVLPVDVGSEYKKGDILLFANTINGTGVDGMTLTVLNMFASKDKGDTWQFVSEIARSSVNQISKENGIWEPHAIANDDGTLIVFYADETDHNAHSQRIVYKSTTDGENWSDIVEVVALQNPSLRPGMPACTRIKDGEYFLTYEMVADSPGVPIYFKKSSDGLNWGDPSVIGTKIYAEELVKDAVTGKERLTKVYPSSSPFAGYTERGVDDNGTIFVSSMRTTYEGAVPTETSLIDFYVSYDAGASWGRVDHPLPYFSESNRPAYSNSFMFSNDGKKMFVVNSIQSVAGKSNNYLMLATVDVEKSIQI